MTPVTLGRDFGTEVEILDGVRDDATVILSPPDSLVDKQVVRVFRAALGDAAGTVATPKKDTAR
jgi:hypothetical protein